MNKTIQELQAWRKKHGLDKEPEIEDLNKADADFMIILRGGMREAQKAADTERALYLACRRLVTRPQACLGCPVQGLQCAERVPTVKDCALRLARHFMRRAR